MTRKIRREKPAPYERHNARISQRARQHLARMRKKERARLHGRRASPPRTATERSQRGLRLLWGVPFALSLLGGIYLARPLEPLLLQWAPAELDRIESIAIQGNSQLSFKDVALATGVARGQSLAQIDLNQVEARLREEPWIKSAHVLRLPPATLVIRVEERQPTAVLVEEPKSERTGRMRLVDRSGVVFASASGLESLPRLIDAQDMENGRNPALLAHGLALLQRLREAEIAQILTENQPLALQLPETGSSQGWVFRGRVEVVLGDRELDQRIERLVTLLQNGEVQALLERPGMKIDLRFAEQAVLQGAEEGTNT